MLPISKGGTNKFENKKGTPEPPSCCSEVLRKEKKSPIVFGKNVLHGWNATIKEKERGTMITRVRGRKKKEISLWRASRRRRFHDETSLEGSGRGRGKKERSGELPLAKIHSLIVGKRSRSEKGPSEGKKGRETSLAPSFS